MLHKFKRGVHPPDEKSRTEGLPIREIRPPDMLVVPLSQHIGTPALPAVSKGSRVDKGSLIGEPSGFISAAVHSPVSGEVVAVEHRPLPTARPGNCVVIRNDHEERWADSLNVPADVSALDADAIRERVRAGGVVGMGGATFPTSVKLSPPAHKRIEILIVNGAECEPYLTADHRLMLEGPASIVRGADLARRAVGAERIVFAVEANKPDAARALSDAARTLPDAAVAILPARYPQGAEKQLIASIAGREVPSGGLPMDVGVLVHNVGTCAAIYDACAFNRPLIERVLTVTGPAAANPGNFRVRVGTLYGDIVRDVGITGALKRVVMGGPMMGTAQPGLDIPVIKGTTGLVLLDEVPGDTWRACIRCGKCIRACPVCIMPADLSLLIEAGRIDEAGVLDLFDCIECGCCSYVCPSKRPIVNWIKFAKADLHAKRVQGRGKAAG